MTAPMRTDPPRMSRWKVIGIPALVALLIVVIPTAIGAINPRVFATPTTAVRAPVISSGVQVSHEVRYTVTVDMGGGDADVTYRNAQGGSEQVTRSSTRGTKRLPMTLSGSTSTS